MTVKLNIGAGRNAIEGFTNLDRSEGTEAYPLSQYADGSVDEIRASHILEHFSFAEVPKVLAEWVRTLKPGGRIRLAVPNFDWIADHRDDPKFAFYAMGGQTDENDFHKSLFTEAQLQRLMGDVGLAGVKRWKSENTDCARLPVSLNLEGVKTNGAVADKTGAHTEKLTIVAVLSAPRYGSLAAWGSIFDALKPWGIPVRRYSGAYWGQCMQNLLEDCLKEGLDMILTLDYDTLFTAKHFSTLLHRMCQNPQIDALAALQAHRGKPTPLMSKLGCTSAEVIDGNPVEVSTAHFGLTLLRTAALKKLEKPWLRAIPDKDGSWQGDDHVDADLHFWNQWTKAGNSVYIAPDVRVGHIAEMVREFDENMQFRVVGMREWREREDPETKTAKTAEDS